jgi:transposase
MGRKRRTFTAAFKASVALAAVKGEQTISELAGRYEVHGTLISLWKKQLLEGAESIFSGKFRAVDVQSEQQKTELFEQIGRLQRELAWLKKKLPPSAELRRGLLDGAHPRISLRRQCELLGIRRSGELLRARPRVGQELGVNASDRRGVFAIPVLRPPSDAGVAANARSRGEREAGRPADAVDGVGGHLPEAEAERRGRETPEIPVPATGGDDRPVDQVWSAEIVYSQMTKPAGSAGRTDRERITDLDLLPGHHDSVDE